MGEQFWLGRNPESWLTIDQGVRTCGGEVIQVSAGVRRSSSMEQLTFSYRDIGPFDDFIEVLQELTGELIVWCDRYVRDEIPGQDVLFDDAWQALGPL